MKTQLFEVSSDQKKLIQDISSICGVKQETVLQVWKFTLLLNYINLVEKKDAQSQIIQIPLFGKIWTHLKDDGELEKSIYLTDSLEAMIKKIKHGDDLEVIKYFDAEFITPVLEDIAES